MKEFNAEEMAEFGRAVDFSLLAEETGKRLGVKVGFETIKIAELRRDRDRVRVVLKSEDIAPHCGIFGKILHWAKISSFGVVVYQNSKTGELAISLELIVEYEHFEGGKNGMKVFDACFIGGEWKFR